MSVKPFEGYLQVGNSTKQLELTADVKFIGLNVAIAHNAIDKKVNLRVWRSFIQFESPPFSKGTLFSLFPFLLYLTSYQISISLLWSVLDISTNV